MGENESQNRTTNEREPLTPSTPEDIMTRVITPLEQQIANRRNRCLFTLYYPENENGRMTGEDVSSIRSLMECEGCHHESDVFIHSGGGDIHAAYKLSKLFQKKCNDIRALIPEYAKSAATLLAIACKKIEFSAIAEIGPLDPVFYMEEGATPGFSIRDAPKILEEEIENCKNEEVRKLKAEFVIGPMAAKLNPYLLTTVKNMSPLANTYGKKLLQTQGYSDSDADRILKRLVYESGRTSHGYVIDVDEATNLRLHASAMDDETEKETLNLLKFYRLYESRLNNEGNPLETAIFHVTRPLRPENSNSTPSSP